MRLAGFRLGQTVPSPWSDLRHGLVLGGQELWTRVRGLVGKADGDEETRWHQRAQVAQSIQTLHEQETDHRVAIWLRVRVGGEQMTMVAAEYGYRDGSGIHRVIQRLDEKAQE